MMTIFVLTISYKGELSTVHGAYRHLHSVMEEVRNLAGLIGDEWKPITWEEGETGSADKLTQYWSFALNEYHYSIMKYEVI